MTPRPISEDSGRVYDNQPAVWPPVGWEYVEGRWRRWWKLHSRRPCSIPICVSDAPTDGLTFTCPTHGPIEAKAAYLTRSAFVDPPLDIWVHRRCGNHVEVQHLGTGAP